MSELASGPSTPAGQITLTGLRARGNHGVFDHERRDGQEFGVDLRLWFDMTAAAASDELADTIDYGAVADLVVAHITGEPVNLIEKLAARIADAVLGHDERLTRCEITVHKPSAPIPHEFADVAVTVSRSRV
ncbi:dihydroneopterin aldolase [Sciscionella sediminilitoris]|uniref:dihydroneopterin aldolase n=1 Tax=Sciscionella sediminilitoris TaxID=1445613 RepID=UPI0004DF600D|nr:dihydroneopterin aldolase [Sciscionella sp. SE31]